ncbi:MAG: YceI family protein [Bacteroidota bacterium]|nr:YceI family protein [Bacteroidota bacterium]
MKKYIFMLTVTGLGISVFAAPPVKKLKKTTEINYQVDAAASSLKWNAKKVTGEHSGTLNFGSGTINIINNTLVGALITIDMNTMDVTDLKGEYHDKLVNHLKSDDFFSVQKFNTAVLKVKSAKAIKGDFADNYMIVADLTIKGITKEITFPAIVVINKNQVIVNTEFDIDRTDYDIKYGSGKFYENIGDKAIMDKFNIKVRIIANKLISN